ncbi:Predicted site-specific integrase-resolvase [Desulfurella multipotens]|uniref:Predicted site-specific integrase-resolvase n=1 Tax=Desulfurella multipotens TaxID=79269 RepID=A0A1G6PIR3_9BACT|nr:IS607 family transposase [Desulfurella multipotens]SDC80043.1 Predicted site-specific integrase-resolvase [Desulfurella multipotens]
MKTKEVLNLLRITRQTLTKYVKNGTIRVTVLPSGHYDYNDEDVYKIFNKGINRQTVIYARVSTRKQKQDLENQIEMLKTFCYSNGWTINAVFSDIASGISFKDRKEFFNMLDLVIAGKIERVIISYKDRLSRVGFDLFGYLFKKYNTQIVVVNEIGSKKLDSEEIFEEIVSLLHCYSMKLYSKRKKTLIDQLIKGDSSND